MRKLGDKETQKLLNRWKIPYAEHFLAKSPEQAVRFAERIGYPVVLKVESPDVIHKTETGGVETNIRDEEDVRRAFKVITRNVKRKVPKARVKGILIQKMFDGREIIVGSKIDPQFGPVIVFGFGGIFVESLKDVTFRVIPIKRSDAKKMIKEIRGYKILQGVRGLKPVNFRILENCLLKVSEMVWKSRKPAIKELDINPLFVNEKGVVAVDVRIIID